MTGRGIGIIISYHLLSVLRHRKLCQAFRTFGTVFEEKSLALFQREDDQEEGKERSFNVANQSGSEILILGFREDQ